MNQNDYALLKMLDMQAAWIGMRPPGDVKMDEAIESGARAENWRYLFKRDSHSGAYGRQHLRLFPDREETDCRRYALCRQHRAYGSAGGIDGQDYALTPYGMSALPDETEVIPGHGPVTTIGEERETEPVLAEMITLKSAFC